MTSPQFTAWKHLQAVSEKWFHSPDFIALRTALAVAKSLDTDTKPIWLMIIGPSSSGKSEFYGMAPKAYRPHYASDDFSLAGLMSMSVASKGKGVLQSIGSRGLWLISDYSTVLGMSEDKRNAVIAACRRIYDGEYSREANGEKEVWKGHVNVIAGCTPAIEKFTKMNAELGERYLQIRVKKAEMSDNLVRCVNAQNEHPEEYRKELVTAANLFLKPGVKAHGKLPFSLQRLIMRWAEFAAMCRVGVERNWKEEIVGVNHEEGCGRIGQQMLGLACGDAALFGHETVQGSSLELVKRVAYDCIPWARAAILRSLPQDGTTIRRCDLQEIAHISHSVTFTRALDELEAIGMVKVNSTLTQTDVYLSARPTKLLQETIDADMNNGSPLESMLSHDTPPI